MKLLALLTLLLVGCSHAVAVPPCQERTFVVDGATAHGGEHCRAEVDASPFWLDAGTLPITVAPSTLATSQGSTLTLAVQDPVPTCVDGSLTIRNLDSVVVELKNAGVWGQCVTGPACIVIDDAGTCFPLDQAKAVLRKARR